MRECEFPTTRDLRRFDLLLLTAFAAFAFAPAFAGCSKEAPVRTPTRPPECIAGAGEACTCSGGKAGTRNCTSAGTWAECQCAVCTPECGTRECGNEASCGISCGSCTTGQICSTEGRCEIDCTNACAGRACGVDPRCGQSCGACGEGSSCLVSEGRCVATEFILSGRTVLLNATVVARVGTMEFEATSDAAGLYQVGLAFDDPAAVVIAQATGSEQRRESFVVFLSVLGTAETLQTEAGADRVLEETEDRDLVINELSTAHYTAIFAAAGGREPAAAAELSAAEAIVNLPADGREMLEIAGAFRMIAGAAEPLPSGFEETGSLARDIFALYPLIDRLRNEVPAFEPTQLAMLDDPSYRRPFPSDPLGAYLMEFVPHRNLNIGYVEGRWQFAADGTGSAQGRVHDVFVPNERFHWSMQNGVLRVDYDRDISGPADLVTQDIIDRVNDPSLSRQIRDALGGDTWVTVPRELLSTELTLLHEGPKLMWVAARDTYRWRFDAFFAQYAITVPAAIEVQLSQTTANWRLESELGYEPFTPENVEGAWALRVVAPSDRRSLVDVFQVGTPILSTARVVFESDGTASGTFGAASVPLLFAWHIDQEGFLIVDYPDGAQQVYGIVEHEGPVYGVMTWYRPTPGEEYVQYSRDAKIDPAFELPALDTHPDEYWQTTINQNVDHFKADGMTSGFSFFGFRFDPRERAQRLSYSLDEPHLVVEADLNWTTPNGTASIERRVDANRGALCDLDYPSCVIVRQRVWAPVAMQGDRMVVTEWEARHELEFDLRNGRVTWSDALQAYVDASGAPVDLNDMLYFIPPRLNVYYLSTVPTF